MGEKRNSNPLAEQMRKLLFRVTHNRNKDGKWNIEPLKDALALGESNETTPESAEDFEFILIYATACQMACSHLKNLGPAHDELRTGYGTKGLQLYDKLLAHPHNRSEDDPKLPVKIKTKKASLLLAMQKFGEAEAICFDLLALDPNDGHALTILLKTYIYGKQGAKLRSTADQYHGSLATADKRLCLVLLDTYKILGQRDRRQEALNRLRVIHAEKKSAKRGDPTAGAAKATGRPRDQR
ncbi:MAG: hypothetical protein EYC62_01525 [Alphaproteobacteria bacterium]|nr:MAG: hypothetical protein EYC62_01525 [Alphaproteobacteria bacterium]